MELWSWEYRYGCSRIELASGLGIMNTLLLRVSGSSGGDERKEVRLALKLLSSGGELEGNGLCAPALAKNGSPPSASLRLRFRDASELDEVGLCEGEEGS